MLDHKRIFDSVINSITIFILYILLITLILGVAKTLLDINTIILGSLQTGFGKMVSSILTIFILIDLFKAFMDYHEHEQIKLRYVTDATILVVMREIAIGFYGEKFESDFVLGIAILLLVLGAIRVLIIKYPPREVQNSSPPVIDK